MLTDIKTEKKERGLECAKSYVKSTRRQHETYEKPHTDQTGLPQPQPAPQLKKNTCDSNYITTQLKS